MYLGLVKGFKRTNNNSYWMLFCRNCYFEGGFNTGMQSHCPDCNDVLYILSGKTEEEINKYIRAIKNKNIITNQRI